MIKIKSTYTKYLNGLFMGRLAYIINLDSCGFEEDEIDLAKKVGAFDVVLIKNTKKQEDKLSQLCLEIKKTNHNTKIIIQTNALKKINGINNIKGLIFLVKLKLKKSLIDYDKRINEKNVEWFNKRNSLFLFEVNDVNEFDEINLLIANTNIRKQKVYVTPLINVNKLIEEAFTNSFNLYFEIGGDLFE